MAKDRAGFDPTAMASAAGAARSGWWKLGDGPWYGTVVDQAGVEWEIEELPPAPSKRPKGGSWRATSSTQAVDTAPTLELLLKKVLG